MEKSNDMENFYENCPKKVLMNDLKMLTSPSPVWVCGIIEQTVGTNILIVSDGTGKSKISNCEAVLHPDNRQWIKKGSRCCIIGLLIKTKGLPEIIPKKMIELTDRSISNDTWVLEVKDIGLYMTGKILPILEI